MASKTPDRNRTRVPVQSTFVDERALPARVAALKRLAVAGPILAFTVVIAGGIILACGGDPGPIFTTPQFPENQTAFNHGRLGLLSPALTKPNELIAFRVLSGLTMNGADTLGAPKQSISDVSADVGLQAWSKVRKTVPTPPAPEFWNTYRSHSSSPFISYENCLSDAFQTAARTLEDRRKQYGSDAAVQAWVGAQDQVFVACSEAPKYPAALGASALPLARADRDYQIAAAHFYAEDFGEAEQRFRAIAADAHSPWQRTSEYMIGRTLLREASLLDKAAAIPLARQQFAKIAHDHSAGSLADSARGLLEHLDAIEHTEATMASLSKRLLLPKPEPNALADSLGQSTYLLSSDTFSQARSKAGIAEPFDWVQTLESSNGAHALQVWRQKRSLPWLTLALMNAKGKDPAALELIGEADRLKPDSPAFGTATYNVIRLRMERGETEQPRTELDRLLAAGNDQPPSLLNSWRAERLRLATGLDDALRWASRKEVDPYSEESSKNMPNPPVLAEDAAYLLNYRLPLSKLTVAAHSTTLPPPSASNLALATWTRAFLLNNLPALTDVSPLVSKAHPDWADSLTPRQGQSLEEWRFRAALLVALHHEVEPVVSVGYQSGSDLNTWWCPVSEPHASQSDDEAFDVSWHLPVMFTPPAAVVSEAEKTTAATEVKSLSEKGPAQAALAPIIFDWAKSHPDDPLVPQALHRLVVVVRYGCPGEGKSNGQISKTAFDLLHKHYPKSPWTAKTPYWFDQ